MTNEEIAAEIKKREIEIATQAEFEFDEILIKTIMRAIKDSNHDLSDEFLELFKETLKMSFVNGARFGFLKYVENRIEQK